MEWFRSTDIKRQGKAQRLWEGKGNKVSLSYLLAVLFQFWVFSRPNFSIFLLQDIIESSKMFQDDKHYRSPIDIQATYGGRSQKLRTSTDHLHKPYISDSRGYLCDTADFNKSRVFDENEWNGNSYANGFFFLNIFSRTTRHLCNSNYLTYFLLVTHDHPPSVIYRKWLDQSSMSVRSKYSITCNEHSFM